METRIRLAIRSAGLPMPVLQHPVGAYDLDMAHPGVLLAVEYDGREHLTPERARRDLRRQAYLPRRAGRCCGSGRRTCSTGHGRWRPRSAGRSWPAG
jgi:hypothetical protein